MSTDQETTEFSFRSRYGLEKLKEGNYHEWVWNIQSLLEEAKLWLHVTGEEPKPDDEDAILKWKELDAKARRMIGFNVSGPLQLPVRESTTAKQAWDELAAIHAPQDRQTQLHLTRELHTCKMLASTPLKDHEATFSSIVESLAATGKITDKMDTITMYLLSLSQEYSSFAREVNTGLSENTTFSQVKGLVRVEQQRLQNLKPDSAPTSDGSVKAHYASGKRSFKGKSNNNNNNGNNGNNAKKRGNCNYCGIPGHHEFECRKKVSDQQHKSNANVGNKTYGGLAYALQAAGDNKVIKDSSIWIADCGATHVMYPDQSMFQDYHEFTQGHEPFVGGINSGLPAVGVGHIPFVDDIGNIEILENVLHVPGLKNGLLSLTRLAMQDGWNSSINPDGIAIWKDSFSVTAPIDNDGLVRFKSKAASYVSAQRATVAKIKKKVYPKVPLETWHERFAHGSSSTIVKLEEHVIGLNIGDHGDPGRICEGCEAGKHHRQSFKSTPDSSMEQHRAGEYIHSDLCGEMQVLSLGGGKYFVQFKDWITRVTKVYIIENKEAATVLAKFEIFKAWSELHTGNKIKFVRTDGGTEYHAQMGEHLEGSGIEHLETVPYSPQSNGVAERMNRTLIDMVGPMLHSSGLPLSLWGEAVVTACYLRNRMSTRALKGGITPYEALHGRRPEVDHLRTFGSVVYADIVKDSG
jgi:hypothetical protein